MKRKRQNRKDMKLELKQLDITEEYEKNNFAEILVICFFSLILILSWLSSKWLIEYQYIFTIHRYTNLNFSVYFPFQVSSIFLYIIDIILIISITIFCNFVIIKIILNLLTKENDSFSKLPKPIFISIILNSCLFLLGILIYKYKSYNYYFYYIGCFIGIISLFCLLKINLDKKYINNYFKIKFENYFLKIIFEIFYFEILLGFNLYYLYYVICQVISYFTNDLKIEIFLGIACNIFFGLVCLYLIFELKSIPLIIFIIIIYLGIFHFQFTIREIEREELNLGREEAILSVIFIFCYIIEFIFITFYNIQKNN